MQWSAPCGGAAAAATTAATTAAAASSVPSQGSPTDISAASVPATVAGVFASSCSSSLQQRGKRSLLTAGATSKGSSSSSSIGPPISAEALRRFFGLKGPPSPCKAEKGGRVVPERQQHLGHFAPSDSRSTSRILPPSCFAAGAPALHASATVNANRASATGAATATDAGAATDAAPKYASSAANRSELSTETSQLGTSNADDAACWRLKRCMKPNDTVSLCNKLRRTAPSPSPHAASDVAATCSSNNNKYIGTADGRWMGLIGASAGATLHQTSTVSTSSRVVSAVSRTTQTASTTATGTASRAECAPGILGGGASGRKNPHSAAAGAAPSVGSNTTAVVRRTRPWVDLPDPLVLQVLDFGGREIAMTCRRFATLIRRQRRVLRFSGDASTASSAEALIRAIMSSPSLRLLEITAGGGLSASQMDRLSRARSSALPQKLQVLVMRRCNKMTDKSLRTLLLRLRDLRCVDLRDSFSLTDEALLTLGLLPRLERVALGLTAGARGCCRLTCRALKALLTPKRQEHQQQKQQKPQQQQQQGQAQMQQQNAEQADEGCICPIKFLSLARCSEMKDFTVLANAKATLEFLDLRGTAIDDSSAHVFAELHNLQVLVLADTAVTTATVSAVVDGCPKLQMLDLSCTGPVSRDCLFRLAFSLQSISRLKLSHTAAIDDVLLAHLLAELPLLRFLDVSHCWRVTSAFCDSHFTVASGKQLKRLGLFGCNVERQKVEAALIVAGATNARLSLHNEMALFEMPRVYATMKGLDI